MLGTRRLVPAAAVVVLLLVLTGGLDGRGGSGAEAAPTTYYVSKNGSNADGLSWATAWNELSQINWTAVQPGDTILVDGGSTSMTYTSTLTLGKSGTSTAPITIKLATEAGRNGQARIFGGRSTLLPYCGQSNYTYQTAGVRTVGIAAGGRSWVTVDGTKWSGFYVSGHNRYGIELSSSSSNLTFRNIEIYDNGTAEQSGSTWDPNQEGIHLSGSNITLERLDVHDNGQDAIQSGGGVANLTIRRSWLYNSRAHPTKAEEPFNECTHSDGLQIYGGGDQSGVTVEDSIVGPGLMQGFILGDSNCPSGACATIDNVTVRNTLFVGGHGPSGNANLLTKTVSTNQPLNYVIDRVTSVRDAGDEWWNMTIDGSGHSVTNSIFVGGHSLQVLGSPSASNNCSWQVTDQNNIASDGDPKFVDATYAGVGAGFADFDFSLGAGTQCANRGTSITSVAVLKSGGATPTPTPTPAPLPLSFEAEAGTITSPFTVTSGSPTYVSQSVETDVTQGGKATYAFDVTTAGDYVVKMVVDAPTTGANSLFVNVDAEPTSPTMVWDVLPLTSGFQSRTVSWRGNGTPDANQYVPKVFTLSAGTHTLIVRGREANVKIDRISIEAYTPPTPTPTPSPTPTPLPTPQTFEAEAGTITAPFTVTTGSPTYVSQPSLTSDPAQGGKAVYTFTISAPGNYLVDMVVNAPDTGANSLFVNVDAEPASPTMVWDILPLTSGFQTRTVAWRGNGTPDAPEISPKVFTLTAGTHQLIVRGREANTRIDKVTIRPQ